MAIVVDAFARRCAAALEDLADGPTCAALGVKDDVQRLLAVLRRFEDRRLRLADPAADAWGALVKDVLYEVDDLADECAAEGERLVADGRPPTPKVKCNGMLACFKCGAPPPKFRHVIGAQMNELELRLLQLEEDAPPEVPPARAVGLPASSSGGAVGSQVRKSVDEIVAKMLRYGKKKVQIFAVVGAAGSGKTTLVKEIFADERVVDNFPIRLWVDTTRRRRPTKPELLKEILLAAGDAPPDGDDVELVDLIPAALTRRFLIVIDDPCAAAVWDATLKDALKDVVARGRILVTAADAAAAAPMSATLHRLEPMDVAGGLALLQQEIGEEFPALQEIGPRIVDRCEGSPLAIKAVAGVLRVKEKTAAAWEAVAESGVWSSAASGELPAALRLCYEDLPASLKQCFLYAALFPANSPIRRFDLVHLWVAEGLADGEDAAAASYAELVARNLLLPDADDSENCQLTHSLVRALACALTADESIVVGDDDRQTAALLPKPRRLSASHVAGSFDGAPVSVKQQQALRAILLFHSRAMSAVDQALLETARSLRALSLSGSAVESLPVAAGELLHLRYLNLDGTSITGLPSSIGGLCNLRTLSLRGCRLLRRLPRAVGALAELRCLRLAGTPLGHVTKRVGELKLLQYIDGLVIGHESNPAAGFDLDDLQQLDELKYLHAVNLERAASGAAALRNKPMLKELCLSEQDRELVESTTSLEVEEETDAAAPEAETAAAEEEDEEKKAAEEERLQQEKAAEAAALSEKSERIWSQLTPPASLEKLEIKNYPGRSFPEWLTANFPLVAHLDLDRCTSCTQLPPLGLLPQLRWLRITSARSVVTVGAELLGGEPSAAFPKLEVLKLVDMKSWEEWTLAAADDDTTVLLPELQSLEIIGCRKLRSLPEGLKLAPSLRTLRVESAHSLKEIKGVKGLSGELALKDNRSLVRIAGLTAARRLVIDDCAKLKAVEGTEAVEQLRLVFPPWTETFYFEELIIFWSVEFPRWLMAAVRRRSLRRFEMRCSLSLLRSCIDGGKNWHVVQQIPEVRITSCDGKAFLRYNRSPRVYDTNAAVADNAAPSTPTTPASS